MKKSFFFSISLIFCFSVVGFLAIGLKESPKSASKSPEQSLEQESSRPSKLNSKDKKKLWTKKTKTLGGEKSSSELQAMAQKNSREKNPALKQALNKNQPVKKENRASALKLNPATAPAQPPAEVNIQDKIENTFKRFLMIIESHPRESKEYKQASSFLERTLYDEVSFESLKLLSELYLQKKDRAGHLRITKALSLSYPEKAESFYLLGRAHQAFSETLEDKDELEANRNKMLESYQKALDLDPKHRPSYEFFLKQLMILDEESQELKHTRESLNVVMDMLKYLKEKRDYILLCEAYYDTSFIRQTQKACVKSIKKNRNDPISLMTLAFSLPDKKKREEKLLEIASKHPKSFKTQYKIGLYFRKRSPDLAIPPLLRASQIQPDHLRLNEALSRLLLRNNREEEAYLYFLKACLLSDGVFLSEFKSALGFLRRKKKIELAIKFDRGVKECFKIIKERRQNKMAEIDRSAV